MTSNKSSSTRMDSLHTGGSKLEADPHKSNWESREGLENKTSSSSKPACILPRVCCAVCFYEVANKVLKACEVRVWNRAKKSFPILSSWKLIMKGATFLAPVKKAEYPRTGNVSEHHIAFCTDKFNARNILLTKKISFIGILKYPDNDAKANRLYRVSVMSKLYRNKGPLLYSSCTDSFLLSQLMDASWLLPNSWLFTDQGSIGFLCWTCQSTRLLHY